MNCIVQILFFLLGGISFWICLSRITVCITVNLSRENNQLLKVLYSFFNPLSANPEIWSNTLKQIVGNLPTICLSVFDHFMNLALKGLTNVIMSASKDMEKIWSCATR